MLRHLQKIEVLKFELGNIICGVNTEKEKQSLNKERMIISVKGCNIQHVTSEEKERNLSQTANSSFFSDNMTNRFCDAKPQVCFEKCYLLHQTTKLGQKPFNVFVHCTSLEFWM